MKSEFWLFGKFDAVLLDVRQVAEVLHVTPKTVQNRVYAGEFPRPRQQGLWHIEDVGNFLDCAKNVPDSSKAA